MENFVNRSKYVSETISIIASFADVLAPFETIQGYPGITITVDSGEDSDPTAMLYLGVSIHNGVTVEQRFKLGVPGTIYEITFQIVSNLLHTFEKTVYLAVLPNIEITPPENIYIYLTSTLYPIVVEESYAGSAEVVRGLFLPKATETFSSPNPLVLSGTLVNQVIRYSLQPEEYSGVTPVTLSGTLVDEVVRYTQPSENYKTGVATLAGTLVIVIIRYTNLETFSAITPTLLGGTLA